MTTTIGIVTRLVGMAIIVDEQGKRHLLKVGEALHAGERLITAAGTTVTVQQNDNETIIFKESQTVRLTEQIIDSSISDINENIVNQTVFQQILAALIAGEDIAVLLDAPAAGGVESDGNTSFVNLDRIVTADGAQNLLDGGQQVSSSFSELRSINLRYFPDNNANISSVIGGGGGGGTGVTLENILESVIVSADALLQIGGNINKTDNSTSLVNANALIGVLTDSISLTDNSNSLVNTDAVTGILSGPMNVKDNSNSLVGTLLATNVLSGNTAVTDRSLSLVNTGVVTGVLSGDTSMLNQSVSTINTGVVAGILSGDTSLIDQSNSLVNNQVVTGLLSGDANIIDRSNSLVNTGVVASTLSGDTLLTDQSNSLVNTGVLANVLSGEMLVNDESNTLINVLVAPSLLSGDMTVNENSSGGLLDLAVIPSILSGSTNVQDNSNALIDVDVVPGILSGPVTLQNEASSPIDVDLALNLLDTSGNLITVGLNLHVDGLLDINLSLNEGKDLITIAPAEGDLNSILGHLLDGELLSQATGDVLENSLSQLNSVPNPLAISTTVLDKVLNGTLDVANPLSAGDLLEIDNVLETLPGSLINTTSISSEVLSLIQGPVLLNTLILQQPVIDNG